MKRIYLLLFLLAVLVTVETAAQTAKQCYKAGEEFMKVAKIDDAIIQYTKAIEIDPDFDKAYISRANANAKLKKYNTIPKNSSQEEIIWS